MKKYLIMALALLGLSCANGCKANKNVETIAPQEFQQRLATDTTALLIDVRRAEEYAAGHLQGATQINWLERDSFEQTAAKLDTTKTLYVYCRSGKRSLEAANYLGKQGFKVVNMQGGYLAWAKLGFFVTPYDTDIFITNKGRKAAITFIKHGTLMIQIDGYTIHIDPVRMFGTDYSQLPKADLLLVTHEHADHYDLEAIREVSKNGTLFVSNGRVAELSEQSKSMAVGDTKEIDECGIRLSATAAYNSTPDRQKHHPKGRDVGFLLDIDDLRIYVSGDTEDIPELSELHDVDIAFLSTNQPYTMTAEQCIHAIDMIRPTVVYPYHYGDTDLTKIVEYFKQNDSVEVRIRQLQ